MNDKKKKIGNILFDLITGSSHHALSSVLIRLYDKQMFCMEFFSRLKKCSTSIRLLKYDVAIKCMFDTSCPVYYSLSVE